MGMDNGVSKLEKQEQTFLFFFSFFCKEFLVFFWLSLPWLSTRRARLRVLETERKGGFFFCWTFENILLIGRGKNKNIFNGAIRQTWLSLGNLLVVRSAQLCLGGVFFVSVVS